MGKQQSATGTSGPAVYQASRVVVKNVLAAMCLASGLFTVDGARGAERVRNGGFEAQVEGENVAEGWSSAKLPGVTLSLDSDTAAHAGSWCARIDGTDPDAQRTNVSGWRQTVPMDSTQPLFFSAWVKAQGVDRVRIGMLHQAEQAPPNLANQALHVLTGTFDWRQVTALVRPAEGTVRLNLYMGLQRSGGTVWFDDVSLQPTALLPDGRSIHEARVRTCPPLSCVAEPRPLVGEPGSVTVRRLDEAGTPVTDFTGAVELFCRGAAGLPQRCTFTAEDGGEKAFGVVFAEGRTSRVRVRWDDGEVLSNPVRPRQPEEPPVFFGDLQVLAGDVPADLDPVQTLIFADGYRLALALATPPASDGWVVDGSATSVSGVPALIWGDLQRPSRRYATTGARILVLLDVNGAHPGGRAVLASPDAVRQVRWRVAGTSPVSRVELHRGDERVRCWELNHWDAAAVWTCVLPLSGATEHWVLAVRQVDGEMAWTSPVHVCLAE